MSLHTIKLSAAANEGDLFRYIVQSFRAFEQSLLSKAREMRSSTREISQYAESGEEEEKGNSGRYLDGDVVSEVSDAVATGLRDHASAYEGLEEAANR